MPDPDPPPPFSFADKERKKFVFQCREDYEQMLLKEANSNETYQFADLTAGGEHELAFSKDRRVRDTTDFLIANGIFHRSDVTLDEGNPDYGPELPHLHAPSRHTSRHTQVVSLPPPGRWPLRAVAMAEQGF